MGSVTVRELRNHGGEVLDRVARGETHVVTRDGAEVAEIVPLRRRRAARQAHLQQAEADFDPVPFDAACARAFGRVAASLRRPGRKAQARAYDALIAATALAHNMPIYTRNPDDFSGIDGLIVHNV